jgi:hypothetical protein
MTGSVRSVDVTDAHTSRSNGIQEGHRREVLGHPDAVALRPEAR